MSNACIENMSSEEVASLLTGIHNLSEKKVSEEISLKDNDIIKSKHCSLSFPKYMRFLFLILDKIELDGTVSLTQKELGEKLGCSRATINSYIKKLKDIDFIEKENKNPNLVFYYYDVPKFWSWWKKGEKGIYLYYLMWQIGCYKCCFPKGAGSDYPYQLGAYRVFGRYFRRDCR